MSTEAYTIASWTVNGRVIKDFRIVYGSNVSVEAAEALGKAICEVTGQPLEIVSDADSTPVAREILLGETNREENSKIKTPTYLNFAFGVVNGKLILKTGGAHSLNRIIQRLGELLQKEPKLFSMSEGEVLQGDFYDDPYDLSFAEGADIRGMSCNMLAEWENYGGGDAPLVERKEVFFSMLDVYKPDVLGLQEVSPGWYASFVDYRDWDKWHILKYQSPIVDDNVYSTVMFRSDRFELLDEGMHYYSKFNNRRCRCVTWALLKDKQNGKEFCYISTHWDGAISKNEENKIAQTTEEAEIVNRFAKRCPVITTGDYNSNEWTEPMKQLLAMTDSSDSKHAAKERVNNIGSWHGLRVEKPSVGSCDHLTVTNKDCDVLKFETMMYNEHAWLYADIRFHN